MDYFNNVLTTFLCLSMWQLQSQKALKLNSVFICVPTMNERLSGLERHEGEYLMTELSFWSEPTLYSKGWTSNFYP